MHVLLLLIFSSFSFADVKDNWFCTSESGKRNGNVMWACGVGEGTNEPFARERALKNAFEEYRLICEESADCANRPVIVEPKRLTCREEGRLWKCYRLIEVRIVEKED